MTALIEDIDPNRHPKAFLFVFYLYVIALGFGPELILYMIWRRH